MSGYGMCDGCGCPVADPERDDVCETCAQEFGCEQPEENPPPIDRLDESLLVARLPQHLWIVQCPVCGEWEWADEHLGIEPIDPPEPRHPGTCLHSDEYGDEEVPRVVCRMAVVLDPASPEEGDR